MEKHGQEILVGIAVDPTTQKGRRLLLEHYLGRRWCRRIANRLHVDSGLVSNVVAGTEKSPRVRRSVAKAMGLPMEQVFPDLAPRSGEAA